MKKQDLKPQSEPLSRRERLQALLFRGAALGAALLMAGIDVPKRPSGSGE